MRSRIVGVAALAVAGMLLAAGCSQDSVEDAAQEATGADAVSVGGSGTATVGGLTFAFDVGACTETDGEITVASKQGGDVTVAVSAGTISIIDGEDMWTVISATTSLDGGKFTASGDTDSSTVSGQRTTDPIPVEVQADCG